MLTLLIGYYLGSIVQLDWIIWVESELNNNSISTHDKLLQGREIDNFKPLDCSSLSLKISRISTKQEFIPYMNFSFLIEKYITFHIWDESEVMQPSRKVLKQFF